MSKEEKHATIYISPEMKKQGIEQAAKEGRSFSNYLVWLISEDKKRIDNLN